MLLAACTAGSTATDVLADVTPDMPALDTPGDTPDTPEGVPDAGGDDAAEASLDLAADDEGALAPSDEWEDVADLDALPDPAPDIAGLDAPDPGPDVTPDTSGEEDTPPEVVGACYPSPRPVILVHGANGSSADYATMIARLQADGWPADWLFAFDAADPKWGCNVDNAAAIQQLVAHAMAVTGQPRVDLVAHSMGTLSSRYYVKNLGGQTQVNTYVTLGGMHHGLSSPCWNPLPICVWNELCQSGEFITELNADPATPGNLNWVSIYGTADETVPNESSYLEGAENIALEGIEHDGPNGLQERLEAYEEVRRVLQYPCW